ncbi:hypothetical protein Tco_0474117 [Tanacetum coccineum]
MEGEMGFGVWVVHICLVLTKRFRRSGRLKYKGPVIEENTIEDAINVEEYFNEDKNISQNEGIENIIGTQVDKKDVGPSTSGTKKVKFEKKGKQQKNERLRIPLGFFVIDNFDEKKMEIQLEHASIEITLELIDIMDVDIDKDEEMLKNWEEQFGTKKVTPNDMKHGIRNSRVADMNFKLNFIVLFTSLMGGVKTKGFYDLSMLYVDGTVCNDFSTGRKITTTTIWTSEMLKERELVEIKSGGLGKAKLAGPYVEEEDDPMPKNLERFMWKMNNYIECIKIKRTGFDKTLDAAKLLYPGNTLLADLEDRYIQSLRFQSEDNERKTGVHTDNQKKTSQSHEPSLEDVDNFDTPMYRMGQQTQLVVFETADKLYKDFEHKKMINNFEIPSFSLGLTQEAEMETGLNAAEYEMGPETQEEVIKSSELCGDFEAEYAGLKEAEYAGLNQAKYDRLIPSEICH